MLFAFALVEVATAAVASAASDLSLRALMDGFVVSSAVIGLSLAVAGWPIALHRPGNAVGWLLLGGGILFALSAAGYALLAFATSPGEDSPPWRLVATATNAGWPWVIALLLPVTLLVFPDGTLLSRAWRWIVIVAAANAMIFVAMAVFPSETLSGQLGVRGYPTGSLPDLPWIAAVSTVLGTVVYLAAAAALIVRYRRGDERVRRQLLWLLLAALVMVTGFVVSDYLHTGNWLSIFVIALVPLAITLAVLRYQLLDIRLVVSRSLLYLVLTTAVVAAYVGLVTVLDATLRRQVGLGSSVLATLLIAGAFNPVRTWLQRRVDRVFYGARRDPVRAIAEVGQRLDEVGQPLGDIGASGLDGVLEALCQVLRLPSASIVAQGRELAAYGLPPPVRRSVPLRPGGEQIGELTVGLRAGETRLDPADERVLALLSASVSVAVRATLLAEQLGRTRETLVTAREEERRRLRRDLHDGLGPVLTGVVLQADAARRLAVSDPERAAALMAQLRTQTTAAIDDIRRLVNELRPPALDGLGLLGALREQATSLSHRVDGIPLHITVVAGEPLPELPAAVEVAAYRIATEALTNVTRHSDATAATIRLVADHATITIQITDNGSRRGNSWQAGVGLTSMHERATELGGTCDVGPGAEGGQVTVAIPLGGRS
jgi:signal transduction histidine kinase